jgi:MarR family transcriptional repressor of emrRAB
VTASAASASAASASAADRAFAANVLGALALALTDRLTREIEAGGHTAHVPAALVTLLWYPDRPVAALARNLRISHPGAVQLADRLQQAGLLARRAGADGRTRLLTLTPAGLRAAHGVLDRRNEPLAAAIATLRDDELGSLTRAGCRILAALADQPGTGDQICRLCDERACPDDRCPVPGTA